MAKLSEKSNEELNRMAAEAMGWAFVQKCKQNDPFGSYWRTSKDESIYAVSWSPTTNLNHAFLLATGDYWLQLNTIRHAQIWRWGEIVAEVPLKDDTPEGIARAITVCFLWAKGVDDAASKRS